jgi:hypothetical protein
LIPHDASSLDIDELVRERLLLPALKNRRNLAADSPTETEHDKGPVKGPLVF